MQNTLSFKHCAPFELSPLREVSLPLPYPISPDTSLLPRVGALMAFTLTARVRIPYL